MSRLRIAHYFHFRRVKVVKQLVAKRCNFPPLNWNSVCYYNNFTFICQDFFGGLTEIF